MVRNLALGLMVVLLVGCETTDRPNFLVVVVDDLGWMDAGFNNPDTFYETPVIDSLARGAAIFTRAYAAASVSSPTRASIFSGKHPVRLGMTDFIGARTAEIVLNRPNYPHPLLPAFFKPLMSLTEVTFAEVLKEAGYATLLAGKWNVGPKGLWPEDQGFDVNRGGWTAGAPRRGNKYFSPYDNPRLENGPPGEHLPDRLASETISFIEDHSEEPFLAYLSFYSVHTPLMTTAELERKYLLKAQTAPADSFAVEHSRRVRMVQNHAVYAGMVESVDHAVGRVFGALERLDLRENTIVIFVSDNGGLSTSEGHPTSNYPLRGGKGWLYEGGVRVPMFIEWPGVTRPGSKIDSPAFTTDIFETILGIAQLKGPSEPRDGMSLVSTLRGEPAAVRTLWWHYPHYSHQGGPPVSSLIRGHMKYLEYYESGERELYDLAQDPGETNNLALAQPGLADELQRELFLRLDSLDADFPMLNPNKPGMLEAVHERVTPYEGPEFR